MTNYITYKHALYFVGAWLTCYIGYKMGLELWCLAYPYING